MEESHNITEGQASLASTSDHQAKLIFVDDERNILTSLKRLFRPVGYHIVLANSGAEALQIMNEESFDLVISDMRMPEMSGAEFLEQVANKWPDTIRLLLTGYADMSSTVDAINKGKIYQYISKPWDDSDIKIVVEKALQFKNLEKERNQLLSVTRKQNQELKALNENLDLKVKQRTSELEQIMDMLDIAHKELKNSFTVSIEVFSSLVEMRGKVMAGHARRTAGVSKRLAAEIGMSEEQVESVMYAGLLHDIGKIGFSDSLLNKTINTMSKEELVAYRKHPVVGEAALLTLEPFAHVSKLIRHHHENYDGSGFPDGLAGEEIPIGARILSLVSDYDSLCNGTMISTIKGQAKARVFIHEKSEIRYDPDLIGAFFEMLGPIKKDEVKMRKITSKEMEEEMILAKNIVSRDGVLLLSEGFVLNNHINNKISSYEKFSDEKLDIYIQIQPSVE